MRNPSELLSPALIAGAWLGFVSLAHAQIGTPVERQERVIVTLTAGTDPAAAAKSATAHGAVITHMLHHGFSAILSSRLISELRSQSSVSNIEPDQIVWASQQQCTVQSGADWGLARISERALQLDGNYQYESDGSGVNVYVLDTGIDSSNPDFGGRATFGADFVDGTKQDCNGHGTAVAGTVGGTKYGVAKKVSLIAVRVLNCFGVGFDSDVVSGINWVVQQYQATKKPTVAVLGFTGPFNKALNDAVTAASRAGVVLIAAAGNERADACNFSPASAAGVITIAASDIKDRRAWFSNGGTCVGMFAPGVNITSDWLQGKTLNFSGTSMSAAFVAGVAALTLKQNPTWTPDQVVVHLKDVATKGVIHETPDNCTLTGPWPFRCAPLSPNLLLYSACDI